VGGQKFDTAETSNAFRMVWVDHDDDTGGEMAKGLTARIDLMATDFAL
jgi:hypothetical protein